MNHYTMYPYLHFRIAFLKSFLSITHFCVISTPVVPQPILEIWKLELLSRGRCSAVDLFASGCGVPSLIAAATFRATFCFGTSEKVQNYWAMGYFMGI